MFIKNERRKVGEKRRRGEGEILFLQGESKISPCLFSNKISLSALLTEDSAVAAKVSVVFRLHEFFRVPVGIAAIVRC